jgi:protein-disulfide isomerase
MSRQPLFIGVVTLIAVLLLIFYGVSALSPTLKERSNDSQSIYGLEQVTSPKIDFANPSIGPTDAPLTVVLYSDYLCPNCVTIQESLMEVLPKFPDEIRLVWKDLPNTSLHPQAREAARAARCAGEQSAFWEYHDLLLARQSNITPGYYAVLANELNLDSIEFSECMNEQRTDALIQRDLSEAIVLGIDATPYMFIGDKRISGSMTPIQLEATLRSELAAAKAE